MTKAKRRGAFSLLVQGTVDKVNKTFTPPRFSAGHLELLTQGSADLAGQDFARVLAQVLQDMIRAAAILWTA